MKGQQWQGEGAVPKVRGLGLQGCSHVTPRKVILQPVMMKKPFTRGTPDSVTCIESTISDCAEGPKLGEAEHTYARQQHKAFT